MNLESDCNIRCNILIISGIECNTTGGSSLLLLLLLLLLLPTLLTILITGNQNTALYEKNGM